MSQASKTQLIIERSNGAIWGRIKVKGNLIVESSKTLEGLKKSLQQLAFELEQVTITEFEVTYDLSSFFENYPFLNISEVAAKAGINSSLMRQYAAGTKFPSADRVKIIEEAIHDIGKELTRVKLHKPQKETG